MFVRWKRKNLRILKKDCIVISENQRLVFPRAALICELVESFRDDNGKPRHRFVSYIGSIRESDTNKLSQVIKFWITIEEKLNELNLSELEEKRIRRAIAKKVPCPTANKEKIIS